jgi:hypothetical protein
MKPDSTNKKRFEKEFGHTIPGVFTDEPIFGTTIFGAPNVISTQSNKQVYTAWTERLPPVFRQRYGYDLIPHLPELFFNVEGEFITPARRDYHDCLVLRFIKSYRVIRWPSE